MISTKSNTLTPSAIFCQVTFSISAKQLGLATIMELADKSWPKICEELELSSKIRKSCTENEGRFITIMAVNSWVRGLEIEE